MPVICWHLEQSEAWISLDFCCWCVPKYTVLLINLYSMAPKCQYFNLLYTKADHFSQHHIRFLRIKPNDTPLLWEIFSLKRFFHLTSYSLKQSASWCPHIATLLLCSWSWNLWPLSVLLSRIWRIVFHRNSFNMNHVNLVFSNCNNVSLNFKFSLYFTFCH